MEEYFLSSEYVSFMDNLINELYSRFQSYKCYELVRFKNCYEDYVWEDCEKGILQSIKLYKGDLPCFPVLKGELNSRSGSRYGRHYQKTFPNILKKRRNSNHILI